jgi:hypothetical protein
MPPVANIPDAPQHLSDKAKKQWQANFQKAQAQARLDYPDNESAKRTVATKEANKMLAVPAPESADDIDALEDWQVIHRSTRTKDGVARRHCVTSDGRKYSFEISKSSTVDITKLTKDQLIQHAGTIGVTVDPTAKKDEILAAIQEGSN